MPAFRRHPSGFEMTRSDQKIKRKKALHRACAETERCISRDDALIRTVGAGRGVPGKTCSCDHFDVSRILERRSVDVSMNDGLILTFGNFSKRENSSINHRRESGGLLLRAMGGPGKGLSFSYFR